MTKLGALYDPSQSLSGRSLRNAARSLTNLQIRPTAQRLSAQLAANQRQATAATQLVGGYYDKFGEQARQAVADQERIAGQTNTTLAGIGQDTQQRIADAGHAQQEQLQGLAGRGLDGGSYERLATLLAQQQGTANQNAETYRSAGALQGANWRGLTASQEATGAARGQESLHDLNNAYAQANVAPAQQLADLEASRGDLLAKNVGALRDSERSYQTALGTLGLSTQKAADQAAYQQGTLALRRRDQDIRRSGQQMAQQAKADTLSLSKVQFLAKYGIGPGQLKKLPNPGAWLKANAPVYAKKPSTAGRLTSYQVNHYYSQIDAAKSAIKRVRQLMPQATQSEIRGYISQGYVTQNAGTDQRPHPVQLKLPSFEGDAYGYAGKAAMDLVFNPGGLSAANVHTLHDLGLTNLRARYPVAP